NCAENLRDPIGQQIFSGKASAQHQPERDGRIEMTTRNISHSIGHCQHGQAESASHAEKSDAKFRISCCQNSTAAAAEYKPTSTKKCRRKPIQHETPRAFECRF